MSSRLTRILMWCVIAAMPLFSVACGSSYSANQGSGGGGTQYGSMNLLVSDASTEDWATIGVKILTSHLINASGE